MARHNKKYQNKHHFFLDLARWVDILDRSLENAYHTRPTDDPAVEQALLAALERSQSLKKNLLDLYLTNKN